MHKLAAYREMKLQRDTYILDPIGQCFLINDGYKGLELLNHKLEVIKKIPLFAGATIYSVYKKVNHETLFLDCSDNKVFLSVDLKSGKIDDVEMLEPNVVFFSGLYSWKDHLMLTSGDNNFFILDSCKNVISRISKNQVASKNPLFIKYYDVTQNYKTIRLYPEKYQFIFADYYQQIIGAYSMIDSQVYTIPYQEWVDPYGFGFGPKHFDVQYFNHIFILISENSIEIRKNEETVYITCEDSFSFMRAAPFITDDEIHLIVLGYNKSNPIESFLQQYKIDKL